MKVKLLGLFLLVLSGNSQAVSYATVTEVIELKETRTVPHQVCNNVSVPIYGRAPSRGGAIGSVVDNTFGSTQGLIGAIAGGYIGSKFGRGSGRRIATVAGTAIGSQVGDRYANKELQVIGYENQYRCDEITRTETFNSGYHVIYDYRGQRLSKVVQFRPVIGSRYPVEVSIR